MSDQPTQICDNCFKPFPESKIATHFGYCRRNIKKCQTCGQMYDINFKQDHDQQFHKLSPCKHCKKQFKPHEVSNHQKNCQFRTQFCEYCQLNVPLKDYSLHLKACESRTKNCQKCRKPISNKDFIIHTIQCPGIIEQPRPRIEQNNRNYEQYVQRVRKQDQIRKKQYKFQQPQRQPRREIKYQRKQPDRRQPIYQQIKFNGANRVSRDTRDKIVTDNKGGSNKDIYGKPKIFQQQQQPQRRPQIKQYSNIVSNNYPQYNNNIKPEIRSKEGSSKVIQGQLKREVRTTINSNSSNQPNQLNPRVINPPANSIKAPSTNARIINPSSSSNTNNIQFSNNINNHRLPVNHNPYPSYKANQVHNIQRVITTNNLSSNNNNIKRQSKEDPRNFTKKQVPKNQPIRTDIYKDSNNNSYGNSYQNHPSYNQVPQRRQQPIIPQSNYYQDNDFNHHDLGLDQDQQQLQKAIMMSMNSHKPSSTSTNNHYVGQRSSQNNGKKSYKIDQMPAQFLMEDDMMNQSFYDKQHALYEEITKNKRK